MVEMPELKLQLMGLRVPFYLKAKDARSFWDWFEEAVEPLKHRPVVILATSTLIRTSHVGGASIIWPGWSSRVGDCRGRKGSGATGRPQEKPPG